MGKVVAVPIIKRQNIGDLCPRRGKESSGKLSPTVEDHGAGGRELWMTCVMLVSKTWKRCNDLRGIDNPSEARGATA